MNKNPLKLLLIPLIIAVLYFVVQSFSLVNQFGISSVVEEISLDYKKTNQQDAYILKGQKTRATFKASDNNLGILFVPLVKFGQGGSDTAFRIKREEEEKWHHESTFRGDQVQNNQYFPLGFPPISDSKNNKYVFEIESLAGSYQSGIGVIKDKPAMLMYKYSARDLTDFKILWSFVSKKFIYVFKNINYTQLAAVFVISYLFVFFIRKARLTTAKTVRFLLNYKTNSKKIYRWIIGKVNTNYSLQKKKILYFTKQVNKIFVSTKIYVLLNTNWKKRLIISLLIFLFAFTYRYSSLLVNQSLLFYAGLGGQGDYDQFIRAATCAVRDFYSCPLVLHQNLLVESSILGTFYGIFGFIGGLKVYLYFMLIVSSLVATLPYILLSRKSWLSIGGIIGGLFLANSDFLTQVALSFPPDNLSLFTFSIFYVVYLLTIHIRSIRWLLFFGLVGLIDGMTKALFLINDLVVFVLFIPVFFFEKAKKSRGSLFSKKNIRILLISILPVLVFLIIYSAWEYFVYVTWTAYYFLRSLVETRGVSFVSYTSFSGSSLTGNILLDLFYLCVSALVMLKRLIEYADLQIIFLAPIYLGLLLSSFLKVSRSLIIKRFIFALIFSVIMIALLTLVNNNYLKIHEVFAAEYIFANWTDQTYINIFLFSQIIFLFILNFKYSAVKLSLPIIPYIIMLIILTKNSPFPRISTQVVAWSIILIACLIDYLVVNTDKYLAIRRRVTLLGPVILILFISLYIFPKMVIMITQLNTGFASSQSQIRYLKWVEGSLPENAVILAGGKSDLVVLAENVKRPVIYSSLYSSALLIKPNEIPGINPTDFTIIGELQNKNNFKKNKYMILEDDIYLWRGRLGGVADGVFTDDPSIDTALHGNDYSIETYKSNVALKKRIYELKLKDSEDAK